MEGLDTNGPATLTTEVIDISAYPAGVEVKIDLYESGPLEACPGNGNGCNNVDWIRVEYSLDGGPYADWSSPIGGPCVATCAGGTYVTLGDFNTYYFKQCPIFGNTLRLRISVQCWAGDEYLRIDNILVQGQTCQPVVAFDSLVNVSCNGANDGEIWITGYSANPPLTYSLNGGPFQNSNAFTGLAAGTYTVIVKDNLNKRDTLTNLVITQSPALFLGSTQASPLCFGFSDGEIEAVSYGGGIPPYTFALNGGTAQSSAVFTGLSSGTYSILMTDSAGCQDSLTGILLNDPPVLTLNVTATPTGCNPLNGTVTATPGGGTLPYSYLWNTVPPQSSAVISGLGAGTYTVVLTDSNGCTLTDSGSVASPPLPSVTAGPGDTICTGQGGGQLSALGSGGTGNLTYAWTCNLPSNCNLSNAGISNPTADPTATAWYYVQVTDANGCQSNLDSAMILVEPYPSVDGGPDTTVCEGDSLRLSALVNGNPTATFTYQWIGPNGLLNPGGEPDITIYPTGAAAYQVQAFPSFGCPSLPDLVLVEAEKPFTHEPPLDVEYCPGEPIYIGIDSVAGFSYAWNPPSGLETPDRSVTSLKPNEDLSLMLTITSLTLQSENCRTQDFPVMVTLGDCRLPNVLTPNGDGFNDVLNLGPYFNSVEIHVFDRWGNQVYANTNYKHDWGGTNANTGQALHEGVYFYTVKGVWIGQGNPEADVTQYSSGHHLTILR